MKKAASADQSVSPPRLSDILDITALRDMMEDFYALTSISAGLIDGNGRVLVATSWQDICAKFHRVHPETSRHCAESDTRLAAGIAPGAFRMYKCRNNLWDVATPIVVDGKQAGSLILGQFFFVGEEPDRESFRAEARRYGFDEQAYLAALDRVPRWSRDKVERAMRFYARFAQMISELSFGNVKLAQALKERDNLLASLRQRNAFLDTLINTIPLPIFYKGVDCRYLGVNRTFEVFFGKTQESLVGKTVFEIAPSEWARVYQAQDQELLRKGGVQVYESKMLDSLGRMHDVVYHKATYTGGDGRTAGLIGAMVDVTDRKQSEALIRAAEDRHLRQRNALISLALRGMPEGDNLRSGLQAITETGARTLDVARVSIWRYRRERTVIQCADLYELAGDMHSSGVELSLSDCPDYARSLTEGDVLVADDVQGDPRTRQLADGYLRPLGITSMMDAPINQGGIMIGVLCHEHVGALRHWTADERTFAAATANLVALALTEGDRRRAEKALRESSDKLHRMLDGTIKAMIAILEARDPYTAGHERRVAKLAAEIGRKLGLSRDRIEGIRIAAYVHDIGKIAVPTEILSKPGRLNDNEMALVRAHSQNGYDMVKDIDFIWPVAQIVLQHHERMDGSGYPRGLRGDKILLDARILAVADVVEAMSSHRPYRAAPGIDKALEEISEHKGVLYDPACVDACVNLFRDDAFRFDVS